METLDTSQSWAQRINLGINHLYYWTRTITNTKIMHLSLELRKNIYTPGRQKKGNDRAKSDSNELEKRKTGKQISTP